MTVLHAIILAGGLRPAPIVESVGMPVPCLPLVPDWTVLGLWCCTLDRLAAEMQARCLLSVIVSSERDRVDVQAAVDACLAEHGAGLTTLTSVEVRLESSRWRGTGGMVRDLLVSPPGSDPDTEMPEAILVIEGGAVPGDGLGNVLPTLLAPLGEVVPHGREGAQGDTRSPDAVIAVAGQGVPAGVIALRPSALEFVPTEGFCDLKEQLLPELHARGRGAIPVELACAVPRVRSCAGYLAAVRLAAAGEPLVHPSARIDDRAVIDGVCLVGRDVVVEAGARVQDAVLMDGCQVRENAIIARSVVTPGSVVDSGMIWRDRVVRLAANEAGTVSSAPDAERATGDAKRKSVRDRRSSGHSAQAVGSGS